MRLWLPIMNAIVFVLVQVSFGQVENPKRVNAIQFTGNTIFDEATLKNQLRTVKVGALHVTSSDIERDIEKNLKPFFKEHGFVQCRVTFEAIPLTAEDMDIRVVISEGSQYRLASLNFTGITLFKKEAITPAFDMQLGEVVNFKKIKEGLDTLQRIYANYGFIKWSCISEQTLDEQNKTISLSFNIDEGLQYFIGYVAFIGCRDQAEEERLKKQALVQPRLLFSPMLLQTDTLRLSQTLGFAVKALTETLPEKGLVGIIYWLNPVITN